MQSEAVAGKAADMRREPLSADLRSDAINIARVICILGIVYVHGWTGLTISQMGEQPVSVYSLTYWVLVEVLGRSAVPLLSVISGWLIAQSVHKRRYPAYVYDKMVNLLAPMAAWNLITLFVIGVAVVTVNYHVDFVPTGIRLVNETINLTQDASLNYQTAFLRDIFVCMLAVPVFTRLPTNVLWAVMAGALVWSIADWHLYVLLRPQILVFFVLGMIARRGMVGRLLRHVPAGILTILFVLLAAAKIWTSVQGDAFHFDHLHAVGVLDNLLRFAAAAVYWRMALWAASSWFSEHLLKVERYIFVTFCSHILIARLMGPLQAKLIGDFGNPLWLLSFVAQPLAALASAWVISQLLLRFSPALAGLLSGGRLTRGSNTKRARS